MGWKVLGGVFVLLLFAFAAIVAFGDDLSDVLPRYRAELEPVFARLPAIREAAKTAPWTERETFAYEGNIHDDSHDLALVYLEDLEEPKEYGTASPRMPSSRVLTPCVAVLATHRHPFDPAKPTGEPASMTAFDAEKALGACRKLRTLLVLRTRRFAPLTGIARRSCTSRSTRPDPTASATPTSSTAPASSSSASPPSPSASSSATAQPPGLCDEFDGGYLEGDVLAFDLRDGRAVGSFRVRADAPSVVAVHGSMDQAPPAVASAFAKALEKAVLDGARRAQAAGRAK